MCGACSPTVPRASGALRTVNRRIRTTRFCTWSIMATGDCGRRPLGLRSSRCQLASSTCWSQSARARSSRFAVRGSVATRCPFSSSRLPLNIRYPRVCDASSTNIRSEPNSSRHGHAMPLALARHEGRTILVLADPGGEPLDRILDREREQPLDLTRVFAWPSTS